MIMKNKKTYNPMLHMFDEFLLAKDAADKAYDDICNMIDMEYDRLFRNHTGMLVMNEPFTWKPSAGESYTVSETGPIDELGIMKVTGCVYDNGDMHDILTAGPSSRRLALMVIERYHNGGVTLKVRDEK